MRRVSRSDERLPRGGWEARGVGLYVHLPFCASRCAYCTFVTSTDADLMPRTMRAVAAEIRRLARRHRRPLASLYLGGGTPSLVESDALVDIVEAVRCGFRFGRDTEVTLEANPDDVTPARARAWRAIGVNRVSLGVQALQDRVLQFLNRRHSAAQARDAASLLRSEGFVLSADVMLGLPGLSAADVEANVGGLLAVEPHHVSVYLLEMDKPHRLGQLAARRPDLFPDDDAAAGQYLLAGRLLTTAGYRHYEISNFALPGHVARHNSRYWLGAAVLAAGVAAHGQSRRRRWANLSDLRAYLERVERGESAVEWSRPLAEDEALRERVMLGLRLARGVPAADLAACDVLAPGFGARLGEFLSLGLARTRGDRVRLTPRGWLVSNELLSMLW
jgi:putative oxygen-independent coproporphyrinogen III oxidase